MIQGGEILKKKRVTALVLATMLFSSTASGVTAAGTNTWKYQNNSWYYLTSTGKKVTGWVLDKNNWYFLGSNGVMKTGWVLDKNNWYFLGSNGMMKTGWLSDKNRWYFLDKKSGAMKTGWLKENNIWYFLDPSGVMKTGWLKDKNNWYFLMPSGAMKTGWLFNANSWYLLDPSGAMKTGWVQDKNLTYFLNPSGAMVTGQKYIDGKPYVFAASGALNSAPIIGWFRDGSIAMYFDQDGSNHKGWLVEGTNKFYFSEDGFIKTGWLTENGNNYYFGSDGKMQTGLQSVDGQIYFFGSDGVMQKDSGWKQIEAKWYYFGSDGAAYKGWLTDKGSTYYLSNNGDMVIGWLKLDSKRYYFDGYGKMVTGEQIIDGKLYNFFENGVLNTGPVITTTNYNLTFQQMLDIEMKQSPQTDKYKNNKAFVSSDFILRDANDPTKGVVTAATLNVREETNADSFLYGTLKQNAQVQIVSAVGTWYEIKYGTWRNAKAEDVSYYLNPNNFSPTSAEYFQFLLLNKSAGTVADDLNKNILAGKGTLDKMGDAFIQAGKQNNVNEVYLISHALLETGNGKSNLASGKIIVSMVDGKPVEPKPVYNMYGIGAIDSCPETCGAETAYKKGWFTPEQAIIGGAEFIGAGYINASTPQNTLYKMRWNPITPYHQYATDIGWAVKQVNNIKKIYDSLSSYTLYYDISVYK